MGFEERIEALELDVFRIKAANADTLQVTRQMLTTTKQMVLQLERLVETLESHPAPAVKE